MDDISGLGLKCGLEIHQQLGRPTSTKLFSRSLAEIEEGKPDLVVNRKLRASAGESGEVDVAAAAEHAKDKTYEYHAYDGSCSLVELDEQPPQPVNDEAVETAVMVAKALNSTILPHVQFMRKTIVDGSAVSGFQRTALLAIGGSVPGLESEVGVQSICIEEDSAKIVEKTHEKDVYNLSRLGIPLIEIATEPDIRTPEQAHDVARQIGMILRSTGRVKRGLGTIRQDLNVSIKEGTRCEIKGAQDLKTVPLLIENEARRQASLADISKRHAQVRVGSVEDVTPIAKASSKKFVKESKAALGINVKGFRGEIGAELFPGYRLGTELAGIAKTWGFGGIIHSDEDLDSYGLDKSEMQKALGTGEEDAFILILGDPTKIRSLLQLQLIPRIERLADGVPAEVRRANPDGTTSYLRPVPGAARMYPETDIPIYEVDTSVEAPKLITEQVREIEEETGLSRSLAEVMVKEGIPFMEYVKKYPELESKYLSSALLEWPKDVETRFKTDLGDPLEYVDPLLQNVHEGTLPGESVKRILEHIAEHNKKERFPPEDVLVLAEKYERISEEELEAIIGRIVEKQPDARPKQLMGLVMSEVKGRADGKRVMRILSERLR